MKQPPKLELTAEELAMTPREIREAQIRAELAKYKQGINPGMTINQAAWVILTNMRRAQRWAWLRRLFGRKLK